MILAFDTSAARCAAALVRGGDVLASAEEEMARGQAERLFGLCQELLATAGAAPGDLAAIGVGTGPGNFTGIRISVSAARGLALGLRIPAVGVTAFDALRLGTEGACACAVAAPRDQVYLQTFGPAQDAPPALHPAAALPRFEGPLIGAGGRPPVHPSAVAIALIAAMRCHGPVPRPAPLYLRPADAAPARDTPPEIVP